MTRSLEPRLTAALLDEFRKWSGKGTGIFLQLRRQPILIREVPQKEGPPKKYGFLDLPHLLRAALEKAGLLEDLLNWSRIVRPFAIVRAARFAARLCAQLDVEPEFRISAVRDRVFEETLWAGLGAARGEARAAVPSVVAALCAAILDRPAKLGIADGASRLRIRTVLGHVFGEWRDRESRLLCREPMEKILAAVLKHPTRELAEVLRRAKEARIRYRVAGDRLLRSVCPGSAKVRSAAPRTRPFRIRVFHTVHRGVALDAWIVVHPLRGRQDLGSCTLCVRRGHDSFVIESAESRWFYFPPTVLVSTIGFNGECWSVGSPLVFEPRNGYPLQAHPYTGSLGRGFEAVTDMGERDCPLLPELTPLETMLFPSLMRRTAVPAANDLCLLGQSATLEEITVPLRAAEEEGREPDVLGFFLRSLDIARRGLTYAHQQNFETPRTNFVPGALPYPVTPGRITGPLAKRVFPFNPARRAVAENTSSARCDRL